MSVYIEKFVLPNYEQEEKMVVQRMGYNGGMFGYIDNIYPCTLFSDKGLRELDFSNITILYGDNGSGKSTLLNIIANKLRLKRVAPYNTSELFDNYVSECKVRMGFDDEGEEYRDIPQKSAIITSDDIFEYMLTARESNKEVSDDTQFLHDEGYAELKYGKTIQLKGIENYDEFRLQALARKKVCHEESFCIRWQERKSNLIVMEKQQ